MIASAIELPNADLCRPNRCEAQQTAATLITQRNRDLFATHRYQEACSPQWIDELFRVRLGPLCLADTRMDFSSKVRRTFSAFVNRHVFFRMPNADFIVGLCTTYFPYFLEIVGAFCAPCEKMVSTPQSVCSSSPGFAGS
eukprot:jgi/Psemu1/300379/fgenesh1_kg.11_\